MEYCIKTIQKYQSRIFLDDLVKGKYFILIRVQEDKFAIELTLMKQNLPLHKSKILPLQPFVRNELLHVGGRLKHSFLPEESKHPIIAPKDHHIIKLISGLIHEPNHHCGRDHLVSLSREKYWIISCKSVIEK